MTAPDDDGQVTTGAAPDGVRAMAAVRWGLVALMAIAAVASIAYVARDRGGHAGGHGAAHGASYYCPMHPAIVSDQPGECPICHMALVPIPAAATPAAGMGKSDAGSAAPAKTAGLAPIQLTPERIQLLGMRTAKVTRAPLEGELRTVGVISPNERGQAQISTRFSGWIQQLKVSQTGDRVSRGQVLAAIYSPDVQRAVEEFLAARRWSGGGATAAGGAPPHPTPGAIGGGQPDISADARARLELLGISEQEIAEISRAGHAQKTINIRSPVSGTVIRKTAVVGLYVQPGMELFSVADLSTVWVLADVYQQDVGRVRVGQPARLQLGAYPGETFTGRVGFLYPTVDPATQTLRVRVEFRNPGQKLRPGMHGTVLLDLPRREGLVIPAEAAVDTGEQQHVFVAGPDGRFEPRRVRLGARSGPAGAPTMVQVLEGLADGETVVTTANFLLDSESRLRAALEGAR